MKSTHDTLGGVSENEMYERDTQSTTSADTTMQPLASDEREEGILILGGTPIGNLSDASDRLRQALGYR